MTKNKKILCTCIAILIIVSISIKTYKYKNNFQDALIYNNQKGFLFESQLGMDIINKPFSKDDKEYVKAQTLKSGGNSFHLEYDEATEGYVVTTKYFPYEDKEISNMLISSECSEGSVQVTIIQDDNIIIDQEISTEDTEYDISNLNNLPIEIQIKSNSDVKDLKLDINI